MLLTSRMRAERSTTGLLWIGRVCARREPCGAYGSLSVVGDDRLVYLDYRSVKSLDYFDCQHRRMAVAEDQFFSGQMASGELVDSTVYSRSDRDLKWEKFDVSDYDGSRIRVVCGL